MENPRRLLSMILLGDALVNLPLIILCLFVMRELEAARVPFWAAALLIFGLVVFLCDLVPKVAGLTDPYRVAKLGVRVMGALAPVFDPVARQLQRWSEAMAGRHHAGAFEDGAFSERRRTGDAHRTERGRGRASGVGERD